MDCSMREGVLSERLYVSCVFEDAQVGLMRQSAENNDYEQARKERELAFQEGTTGRELGDVGFVVRRSAVHRSRDEAVDESEPVVC
jgi:hypothetical protein